MSDKKCVNYTVVLSIIIALLLFIIWEIYYFSNKLTPNSSISTDISIDKNNNEIKDVANGEVEITMITDERCWDKCDVNPIISQLKQIPSLSNINIKVLDYSDDGAKDKLEKTGSKKLPIVLFNTNSISELSQFLKETNNWMYSLELWAEFDPLAKRSDKGFLVLDKEILKEIKSSSYLKWNKDAKITWIEYSDLECPFCAKLHNSGTPETLRAKYGDNLNEVFQNFPLGFHKNALPWAEALECLGKEKGMEAYYELKHRSFKNEKSDLAFLTEEAIKLWANKNTFTKCVEDKTFAEKINKQQKTGTENFGVTGTPWNVLVNNETGEYAVISWAYPASSFEEIIDRLLK